MIDKDIEILEEFKENGFAGLLLKYDKDLVQTNKMIERSLENVLKELEKYKMISDKLAEKLELLIFSIYHKEEILSVNINKVKEYYENNKLIKAALIKECEEELVCFLRERGRRWAT